MNKHARLGSAFIASLCLYATSLGAQADPDAVALGLRSADREEQWLGLRALRGVAAQDIDPAVRQALIEAGIRDNRTGAERMDRLLSGTSQPSDNIEDEFGRFLFDVLVTLRDPQTIPVLLGMFEAGAGGIILSQAVAEFGELAADQTLVAVMDPASNPSLVLGGLSSLRVMVELSSGLSVGTLEAMRLAAERHLNAPGRLGASVLRRAIDLAGVLSDPRLDEILLALASDPAELEARGIPAPNEGIQALAQQALARVPPLPRPR